MKPVRNSLFALLTLAAAAVAAADPTLLNMVPADAKIISGVHVDQSKSSPFGQYVLAQMHSDDPGMKKFVTATGFDPRRDLNEIVAATSGTTDAPQFVVLGRGIFNPSKILSTAKAAGVLPSNYNGVDLLTHKGEKGVENAVGFLDASTAIMGATDAVKLAIDRRRSGPFLSAALQDRIRDLSNANDAWFISTGPITNFIAGKMGDPGLNQAMNGNLLQAVLQASGGVKFDQKEIRISGEALTRSDKDATALADVIRFIAGLVQMNKDSNPQAKTAASLLDTMKLSTQDAVMKLSLSIPEEQAEKLFMPQQKSGIKGRRATAQNR